tara:strand:+ start:221 stop:1354 length:1134 start_codon:yes stop_codon:yes gene_type:complete
MNFFSLSNLINNIDISNIDVTYSDTNNIYISYSLYKYLTQIKQQINNHIDSWDNYKKNTNPYEYIHTIIPDKKYSISKLKPLSRSFYKIIEICNTINILPDLDKPINSFHLAEGPGGFIEGLIYLHNNKNNKYYGMTLQSTNIDIPGWKKSRDFLKENTNVFIENGTTNDGNLLKQENLKYCYNKYKGSIDIITGDGGFDFSLDFDNQEQQSIKLLYAQICYALSIQKENGTFILKIFDIFTKGSLDLIYILCCFYSDITIMKPYTSRIANSEKYLICKNFKVKNYKLIEYLINNFDKFLENDKNISGFLNIDHSLYFINKIEEASAIFGQQQMENINNTINKIINNDSNSELIKNNIQKCIYWCNKNNIPINNYFE